ncbi:MAG: biphenyl-2,3-diol 1,2-dioxygenase [Sphingomonadales bacterium]|nr:biphenyl-2,3-diol 1,2-dioxygenase [Sphingomonadales bacterium]
MRIIGLDHIVLVVADVARTCAFYERTLGMQPIEHRPGQWALRFGANKISLQSVAGVPAMAVRTGPGSGNFCVLADAAMTDVVERLRREGIDIIEGPAPRVGAAGNLMSVYFYDPDGNLVEVSTVLPDT